jgi:hypothetical protein
MKTSSLLMGCGIGCIVLIVFMVVGGFFAYRYWMAPQIQAMMTEMTEVGEPGIVTGAGFLQQTVFLSDPRLGTVTDIAFGKLDPTPGVGMVAAGGDGAVFATADGKVKSFSQFSGSHNDVDIVDVEGDGVCEFINRGPVGSGAALIGHSGNTTWAYGEKSMGVNDMCGGDVNGDGQLEFAVGFNGAGGVHLVDGRGKVVWRRSDRNVWHVEMMDVNGDGKPEILHSNAGGQLTVRDASGDTVSQTRLRGGDDVNTYLNKFSLCHWPTKSSPQLVMVAGSDEAALFDSTGTLVAKFTAEGMNQFGEVRGALVKLQANAPEYFAALTSWQMAPETLLYVYDANKTLVYEEILPGRDHAIAVAPIGASGAEALLIGAEGRVLKYAIAAAGGGKPRPSPARPSPPSRPRTRSRAAGGPPRARGK